MSGRRITPDEERELRELHHIILCDMAVDAGPAVIFALRLAAEAIEAIILAGVVAIDD